MNLVETYFDRFEVPAWVKESLKERSRMTTMRVYVVDGKKYPLMTSELKAIYNKDVRYSRVSIEEWAKMVFECYVERRAMFQKLPFELVLTVFQARDPRGNGCIGTMSYALTTWREEQAILDMMNGGRFISMMQIRVGINEWMECAFRTYFEEVCPAIDPSCDYGMEITLEEMQEYEENLTEDEKLGNL